VLGGAEDGIDELRSLLVELAAAVGGQHRAHGVVGAAVPPRPGGLGVLATTGVGWDEHWDALAADRVHLLQVPVAGIGSTTPGSSVIELVQSPKDLQVDAPDLPVRGSAGGPAQRGCEPVNPADAGERMRRYSQNASDRTSPTTSVMRSPRAHQREDVEAQHVRSNALRPATRRAQPRR